MTHEYSEKTIIRDFYFMISFYLIVAPYGATIKISAISVKQKRFDFPKKYQGPCTTQRAPGHI